MVEEKVAFKAVRRAVTAINSSATLKEKLDTVIRATSLSMACGASLMLLDSSGKKLIHNSSWRLPQFYLQKGVLDAEKSLQEVVNGKPVVIPDATNDRRIQFAEMAKRAGIHSILGIPIISGGSVIGSIRLYSKDIRSFTNRDISFVAAMANLVAIAFQCEPKAKTGVEVPPLRSVRSVVFANPSEREFADILDFYNIEWVYEPHSFPLQWEGDRVTEMFTPDFYLPGLDLYIEVTTLKQSLVTKKNRKLSRLQQLYPDVKIMLLHKNEYNHLLARYGVGPLTQARARGISRILYTPAQIEKKVSELAERISTDYTGRHPVMVGIQRGFLCFMADLIRHTSIPIDLDFITISYYDSTQHSSFKITKDLDLDITNRHVIVIEGIVDTGMTLVSILKHLHSRNPASLKVCTLLDKRVRRIADIPVDYIGFEVKDEFLVGYGLDYQEEYRNLPFIGVPELDKPA